MRRLIEILREYGKVAVAFSGGVDSTYLLKVAVDTLGCDNVIAVTARPVWVPAREVREATEFCKQNNIEQIFCELEASDIEGFENNPKNRCYLCKKKLFESIIKIAGDRGISFVAEGSNVDDLGDYRPGLKAIEELGVKSPLREAGLTKLVIRNGSKELGLPTWDKPSFACLASRFVYGETITREKLRMVELAEDELLNLGFKQFRVRIHGDRDYIARIELEPEDFSKLLSVELREKIDKDFKAAGFSYVALDLKGYRTGSMNETIDTAKQ